MAETVPQEQFVTVAGTRIHYLKGGTGAPLVVLHSVEGNLGWCAYLQRLARSHTIYALTLPGFGQSQRPPWLETFADLSRFSLWILQELDLARTSVLGHFMGGWLAAEMAVMNPPAVDRLILVDAAGIQPRQSEITDIFLHGQEGTQALTFFDPQQAPECEALFKRKLSREEREIRAQNQENVVRYCWKPYMYDQSLLHLLPRLHIPTLIVWGREDRIIPLECGELYREAIPGARLTVLEQCGHYPHLEKTAQFVDLVQQFLSA